MSFDGLGQTVPGLETLWQWFGYWPSFHDAEVTELCLKREVESEVRVHAFEMTSEVTSSGHYRTVKHATVIFKLEDVTGSELNGFNHQNVLAGLDVEVASDGVKLMLEHCYGLNGFISAKRMRVAIEPGIPPGSVYARSQAQGDSSA
ncbi:Immunity protein 50 [Bryocella elongata]|uniref:Immunity protein 50 n=1 Tax=Bryocella elongata TaxID=863522 RepID=A0A1H6A8M5_9BACT|nr:Imm50 family immunity protein [Bryocella elongata]SEG45099.1 Immunity protein 50 [Bryocella elongata]